MKYCLKHFLHISVPKTAQKVKIQFYCSFLNNIRVAFSLGRDTCRWLDVDGVVGDIHVLFVVNMLNLAQLAYGSVIIMATDYRGSNLSLRFYFQPSTRYITCN